MSRKKNIIRSLLVGAMAATLNSGCKRQDDHSSDSTFSKTEQQVLNNQQRINNLNNMINSYNDKVQQTFAKNSGSRKIIALQKQVQMFEEDALSAKQMLEEDIKSGELRGQTLSKVKGLQKMTQTLRNRIKYARSDSDSLTGSTNTIHVMTKSISNELHILMTNNFN